MKLLRRCLVESCRGSESKDDRPPTGGLSFWLLERTERIVARFVTHIAGQRHICHPPTSQDNYCPLPTFIGAGKLSIQLSDITILDNIVARFLRATT